MPGDAAPSGIYPAVSGVLIGYPRVSTFVQDLTVQRDALQAPGVPAGRIYVDHG